MQLCEQVYLCNRKRNIRTTFNLIHHYWQQLPLLFLKLIFTTTRLNLHTAEFDRASECIQQSSPSDLPCHCTMLCSRICLVTLVLDSNDTFKNKKINEQNIVLFENSKILDCKFCLNLFNFIIFLISPSSKKIII